jgi:DNA polymerase-1
LQARPEIANEIGTLAVESFKEAGEFFKFRIPITGEFKIGNNWAETH